MPRKPSCTVSIEESRYRWFAQQTLAQPVASNSAFSLVSRNPCHTRRPCKKKKPAKAGSFGTTRNYFRPFTYVATAFA